MRYLLVRKDKRMMRMSKLGFFKGILNLILFNFIKITRGFGVLGF